MKLYSYFSITLWTLSVKEEVNWFTTSFPDLKKGTRKKKLYCGQWTNITKLVQVNAIKIAQITQVHDR